MHSFWLKRYEVPRIPGPVIVALVAIFASLTLVRGLAYVTLTSAPADSEVVIRATIGGIRVWGAFLAIGSASLLAFLALRFHGLIWGSHVWLAAVYACFAITTAQSIVHFGGGYQGLIAPFGAFVWHALFVWLMRPFGHHSHHKGV